MKKFIISAIVLVAAVSGFSMQAQSVQQTEQDYSYFNGIVATDAFEVTIEKSDRFAAQISATDLIHPYVQVYVKDGVLYLEIDRSSIPKDAKKAMSAKGAPAEVLRAKVFVRDLQKIDLHDKSVLIVPEPLVLDWVSVTVDGSAAITTLDLVCKEAKMTLSKNATAKASVKADSLYADVSASAYLNLAYDIKGLKFNTVGSGSVNAKGRADRVHVYSESAKDVVVRGDAGKSFITGKGAKAIDFSDLSVRRAEVNTNSCQVKVLANDLLSLDVSNGSKVYFAGNPKVEIVKVQSSTVMPLDSVTSGRKK